MTLDDLERPKRTLAKKNRLTEPTRKISMETGPYYQRQNVGRWLSFYRNAIFVRIFAEFSWTVGAEWWGSTSRKRRYSDFFFEISDSKAHIIIQ